MEQEKQRLAFIEARDGIDGALAFAKQTLKIYRKAVLTSRKRGHTKPHHASLPEFLTGFIESYIVFKRYVAQHGAA